jgi:hypothetical protein
MARSFNPNDLISLPIVDAVGAVTLAKSLESASLDEKKDHKQRKLPESVKAALDDVSEHRAALQEVLGSPSASESALKSADKREDAAVGALYDVLRGWARLEGEIPQGDVARRLLVHLKDDEGLSFINWSPPREWSAVETRLKIIEREKLDPAFDMLGATPVLKHLRSVHARYGEVTGATKPIVSQDSPKMRERLDALLDSIRHYVSSVTGSVQRKKPETKELADILLKPLAEWKPPRKKRGKDEEGPPEGGG